MNGVGLYTVVVQQGAQSAIPLVVRQTKPQVGLTVANPAQQSAGVITGEASASGASAVRQLNASVIASALDTAFVALAKHPPGCKCPLCAGDRAISFNDPVTGGSSAKSRGLAVSNSGVVTSASTGDKMQAVKTPQSLSASIASVQADAKASAAQEAALAGKRAAEAEQVPSAEKTAAAQRNSNAAPVMGRNVKVSVNLTSSSVAQNNQTTSQASVVNHTTARPVVSNQNVQTVSAQTVSRANISDQTTTAAVRNVSANTPSSQNAQNVQTQNIFSRTAALNTASTNTAAVQQNTGAGRAPLAGTTVTASMTAPANASNIAVSTDVSAKTVSVSANTQASAPAQTAAAVSLFNSAATGGMSARILGLFGEAKNLNPAQNNAALTANLPAGEKAMMQRPAPINLAFVQAGLNQTAVLTGMNGEKLVINGQQNFAPVAAAKEFGGLIFGEAVPREAKAATQPIISFAELSRIAHERDVQKENLSKLINLLFGKIMHKEEDDEDLEGMYSIWRDYLERQREQKDQREKEERRKKKQKRDAERQEEELEPVMAV